jgi:hypothetical protein
MRLGRSIGRAYGYFFRKEEWNIGVVRQPITAFIKRDTGPRIDWLPPLKRGRYIADPFSIAKNGRIHILCEDFDYRTARSSIATIELSETEPPTPRPAIGLPTRSSYPYLLQVQDEIFCVPETSNLREVGLYKAQDFPRKWTKVATLINNFAARDPTIFEYQGQWWLACTGESGDRKQSDLYLWHAAGILGPWVPHCSNPVKRDTQSSRPAGTPFIHGGDLYRPAQDCSRTYGGRIVINRVDILTEARFREEQAAVVEPDKNGPYPEGIHTLSSVGNITLVDGKRSAFVRSHLEHLILCNIRPSRLGIEVAERNQ